MNKTALALCIAVSFQITCMEPEQQLPEPRLIGTIAQRPFKMSLSNDQKLLAMACASPESQLSIQIYDATTCNLITEIKSTELSFDASGAMRFSDNNRALHCASDETFVTFSITSGRELKKCEPFSCSIPHEYFIWNDSLWSIGQGGCDNNVQLFKNGDRIARDLFSVKSYEKRHSVSLDGTTFAYCPDYSTVEIIDLKTGPIKTIDLYNACYLFMQNNKSPVSIGFMGDLCYVNNDDQRIKAYLMNLRDKHDQRIYNLHYPVFSEASQIIAFRRKTPIEATDFDLYVNSIELIDASKEFIHGDVVEGALCKYTTTQKFKYDAYLFEDFDAIALNGTTIAFPIKSGTDHDDPRCDTTVIGIFDISDVIEHARVVKKVTL